MSHCSKQVLILNITRLGDLVQTVPLLARLEQEWPGVAIDLLVDTRLAPMAALLPGLRRVLTYDFSTLLKSSHAEAGGTDTPTPELMAWTQSLATVGYDRVINLTFTRWSGLLAAAIGVPDTRGVTVGQNGATLLRNPWLTQVVDLHQHRRFNRFNLVDLYALGGSGPGAFTPIQLQIPAEAEQWARQYLKSRIQNQIPVAVQIGASHPLKAWRPELFGRTMAALSRRLDAAFLLIGIKSEAKSVQQAIAAYHAAGGSGTVCDAVGQTDVPQLAALLRDCRLLLTNDTGPMHLAVGVGTPVVDLSVGHANFHETGPYGPGHWIVQPIMECSPCSYQQVCAHQSCKEQIVPEQVAQLCLHVLGHVEFPTAWTGVQVYASDVDADGLACYRLRAGQSDLVADWYGAFWRRYWYDTFTGHVSRVVFDQPAPDSAEQQQLFAQLLPGINRAVDLADQIARGSRQQPMPVVALHHAQTELTNLRNRIMPLAMSSPAAGPITVSFVRELAQCETSDVIQVADHQAKAYQRWKLRMCPGMERLREACNEGRVQRLIAELSQRMRGLPKKELVNNGS
jgi:ADP-heptose:LPS heptosyltransferase